MKQETLEEAAENKYGLSNQYSKNRIGFIAGAKWQQENSYSEEEVFKLLCSMPNFFNMTIPQQIRARKEWFEQFNKKLLNNKI